MMSSTIKKINLKIVKKQPAIAEKGGSVRAKGREQAVIEAATKLFAEKGFNGVGIDEIGRVAGITGPAIYSYFKKKEVMLVRIIESALTQMILGANSIKGSSVSDEEKLEELIRFHVTFILSDLRVSKVYVSDRRSLLQEDRARLGKMQRGYIATWVEAIHVVRSDLSIEQAQILAESMIGLVNSFAFNRARVSSLQLAGFVENIIRAAISHTSSP